MFQGLYFSTHFPSADICICFYQHKRKTVWWFSCKTMIYKYGRKSSGVISLACFLKRTESVWLHVGIFTLSKDFDHLGSVCGKFQIMEWDLNSVVSISSTNFVSWLYQQILKTRYSRYCRSYDLKLPSVGIIHFSKQLFLSRCETFIR